MTKRIAIIGNGGGGKTTLARTLAKRYDLPLVHVDSIQYLPGMKIRNREETTRILNQLADQACWLIDGFGSFEAMERRFKLADKIIFVDFPIWRHYWWCTKRQIKANWSPRSELPENCNEATLKQTIELFKIIWRVHREIKPKLVRLFQSPEMAAKTVRISNLKEWNQIHSVRD